MLCLELQKYSRVCVALACKDLEIIKEFQSTLPCFKDINPSTAKECHLPPIICNSRQEHENAMLASLITRAVTCSVKKAPPTYRCIGWAGVALPFRIPFPPEPRYPEVKGYAVACVYFSKITMVIMKCYFT